MSSTPSPPSSRGIGHRARRASGDGAARAAAPLGQTAGMASAGIGSEINPHRLLWCVRGTRYLDGLERAAELVTRPLGASMVAFVAEALPGPLMRGVPAAALAAAELDGAAARARADANTRARFSSLPDRIRTAARIPADGWRLGSDTLFQGSVLLVEEILAALVERSGGDVLLAVPDPPATRW